MKITITIPDEVYEICDKQLTPNTVSILAEQVQNSVRSLTANTGNISVDDRRKLSKAAHTLLTEIEDNKKAHDKVTQLSVVLT